jgi:cytochrome c
MSRFRKVAAFGLLAATAVAAGAEERLGLGREATPEEIAAWNIDVRPDGTGLPEGSGTVAEGEEVYAEQCAVCHGVFGEGEGRWPVLAGGEGTLTGDRPVKTIGSYWPYMSTVFDYVNRAMPFGSPHTLTADEVYSVTAYLMYLNYIVEDEEFELSKANFGEIEMPNEANFVEDERTASEVFTRQDVCMSDCKEDVEITMRAAVLDVTPDEQEADEAGAPADEASAGGAETQVAEAVAAGEDADAELAARGEKVFRQCKACHQIGEGARNVVGPELNGVLGVEVATNEEYDYSSAFQAKAEEGVVWDAETLSAFLEAPMDWAPGTKMAFPGVEDEEDREALVEFLKSHPE